MQLVESTFTIANGYKHDAKVSPLPIFVTLILVGLKV